MAVINRKVRQFSDLNLLFTPHPVSADVVRTFDEEAIKTSIRNLILTRNYERPFHPEIGCQIYSLLFENLTPITVQIIKKTIIDVINKFEPRALVTNINIAGDVNSNSIDIEITFKIINSERPVTFRTSITRAR